LCHAWFQPIALPICGTLQTLIFRLERAQNRPGRTHPAGLCASSPAPAPDCGLANSGGHSFCHRLFEPNLPGTAKQPPFRLAIGIYPKRYANLIRFCRVHSVGKLDNIKKGSRSCRLSGNASGGAAWKRSSLVGIDEKCISTGRGNASPGVHLTDASPSPGYARWLPVTGIPVADDPGRDRPPAVVTVALWPDGSGETHCARHGGEASIIRVCCFDNWRSCVAGLPRPSHPTFLRRSEYTDPHKRPRQTAGLQPLVVNVIRTGPNRPPGTCEQ
jgi:hypothetical protein